LLWLGARLMPAAAGSHGLVQAVLLLVLITGCIAVYGLFLRLFGVTNWRETVNAIRQNRAA
jgi:putative peptidoglycan lipid II flippase